MKRAFLFLVLCVSAHAADITITIPDAAVPRVLNGFADARGYTGTNPQGNPETKAQFAKRQLILFILNELKRQEWSTAAAQSRVTIDASVDGIGVN
jgi:hypothetical protein